MDAESPNKPIRLALDQGTIDGINEYSKLVSNLSKSYRDQVQNALNGIRESINLNLIPSMVESIRVLNETLNEQNRKALLAYRESMSNLLEGVSRSLVGYNIPALSRQINEAINNPGLRDALESLRTALGNLDSDSVAPGDGEFFDFFDTGTVDPNQRMVHEQSVADGNNEWSRSEILNLISILLMMYTLLKGAISVNPDAAKEDRVLVELNLNINFENMFRNMFNININLKDEQPVPPSPIEE